MPATVTLATTTLGQLVHPHEDRIKLASTSGVVIGTRLYCDRELMRVIGVGGAFPDPWVQVSRGVDGTRTTAHSPGATVYVGRADQFYASDPQGEPPDAIPVDPYINVMTGDVWLAQGDAGPVDGIRPIATRMWVKQSTVLAAGALGAATVTSSPTSST